MNSVIDTFDTLLTKSEIGGFHHFQIHGDTKAVHKVLDEVFGNSQRQKYNHNTTYYVRVEDDFILAIAEVDLDYRKSYRVEKTTIGAAKEFIEHFAGDPYYQYSDDNDYYTDQVNMQLDLQLAKFLIRFCH